MGVRISLDDFGAGYSSFAYLQNFGLQALKIDRQFVTDASSHPQRASILRTMLLLARTLGLHTVAEGVESEATLALLRTMECDEYQGFLFARPMPLDQILARFAGAGEARAGVHG
jgi:EAL domain-containing protein (putative c-di-GMP-specific phosphodiesterase class I)